jgi:hypothetical protein
MIEPFASVASIETRACFSAFLRPNAYEMYSASLQMLKQPRSITVTCSGTPPIPQHVIGWSSLCRVNVSSDCLTDSGL